MPLTPEEQQRLIDSGELIKHFKDASLLNFEKAALSAGLDPDGLLYGGDELPEGAAFTPGTFLVSVYQYGRRLTDEEVAPGLPVLSQDFLNIMRERLNAAADAYTSEARAAGATFSIGRPMMMTAPLAVRLACFDPETFHRVRTAPVGEALRFIASTPLPSPFEPLTPEQEAYRRTSLPLGEALLYAQLRVIARGLPEQPAPLFPN